MNDDIKKRLFYVIYLIIFSTFSTWFIFGPREKLVYAAMNIKDSQLTSKDIVIRSNDKLNYNGETYNFSVINKSNKKYKYNILLVNDYRKSILKKCKVMTNNYLKYHIKTSNNYTVDRNVNTNGIIYVSNIEPYEIKNFSIEIWLDRKIDGSYCYYPLLKIDNE